MLPKSLLQKFKNLPSWPGVYLFWDKGGRIIYVGKSTSIAKRVLSYARAKNLQVKTRKMVRAIADVSYIKVFSEFEALMLEADLIKKHQPFFNVVAKDDKSPLYIKISSDPIPLVTLTRQTETTQKEYLKGPFPSSGEARNTLRIIRKIFSYCQHKKPRRPCLYVHLGLCPYPYQSSFLLANYQKNIKNIKKLLSGKVRQLVEQLKREIDESAKKEKFEEAQIFKKQIESLERLLRAYHSPIEFLRQPTLVDDFTAERLKDLKTAIGLSKISRRIECYDISQLAGEAACGSMVVFTNGQPDRSEYRRFKIKQKKKTDDYAMIQEVLTRRLKNDWPEPDLIIIDGGRGHLNSALSILTKFRKNFPIISLAKKYEEIYTPFKVFPMRLPAQSPTRQLVEAIRDEAHRFAVAYHRLLRSKHMLPQNLLRY